MLGKHNLYKRVYGICQKWLQIFGCNEQKRVDDTQMYLL